MELETRDAHRNLPKRLCGHKTRSRCRKCERCFACCPGHRLTPRRIVGDALDHITNQPWPYTDLAAKYEAVGILLWALHEVVAVKR